MKEAAEEEGLCSSEGLNLWVTELLLEEEEVVEYQQEVDPLECSEEAVSQAPGFVSMVYWLSELELLLQKD